MNKPILIYTFTHFEALLSHYLKAYHPHFTDDKLFITDRLEEVYSLYQDLLSDGVTSYAAYDLALKVLFDGL